VTLTRVSPLVGLIAACLLQSGCAAWFERQRPLIVTELAQLPACGEVAADTPPQVYLFDSAFSVREWQQRQGMPASQIDESIEGPFVLVALGTPSAQGNSLLVSREAVLHNGGRLVLSSTIYNAPAAGDQNPCVLLALPPREYDQIDVFDQEGALRASTASAARSPPPEATEPSADTESTSPPTTVPEEQGQ
jgi:hypothetical protein